MITNSNMRHSARKAAKVASVASFMVVLAAASAIASTTAQTSGITTHTELTTATQEISGHTVATYTATVLGEDGAPATGSVTLIDGAHRLASAALDASGKADIRYDALSGGYHTLTAVYNGDAIHLASQSPNVSVHADATTTPGFALGINVVGSTDGTTMTLAAPGDSGTVVTTITPTNGFTGFISLSCSGPAASTGSAGGTSLPVGVTCTFAPANLQILAPTTTNTTGAQTADMALVTSTGQQTVAQNSSGHAPLALAILLPGIVGLGYLGRKRKLFAGIATLALIGSVTMLGTTGCAARYRYLNHGPGFGGTAAGTYTITITAQTSNGVTSSIQSQTMTLVVK